MRRAMKSVVIEAACTLAVFAATILLCIAVSGCSSTPTGVRVVSSSATATNLGDINWDEYKIPVFSIFTGPRTTIWINRDYLALKSVTAGGCVTNDTSALGVYSSKEKKETRVQLEFAPCATNAPACPASAAPDAAHKVPIAELGIEIDATDAARFFDWI